MHHCHKSKMTPQVQDQLSKLNICIIVLILSVCVRFNAYAVNLRAINSFLRKLVCTELQLISMENNAVEPNTLLKQMAILPPYSLYSCGGEAKLQKPGI